MLLTQITARTLQADVLKAVAQVGVFVGLAGCVERLLDCQICVLGAKDHALTTSGEFIGEVVHIAVFVGKRLR